MKKLYGIIIASFIIIMCLPVRVYAKDQTVTLTSSTAEATKVSVKGSTEAAAVMVQVRDGNDNILALETFGTLNKEFSGEVTGLSLAADTDYKVFVADYEGGKWTIQTVKYETAVTPTPTPTPAKPDVTPSNNSGAPAPAVTNIDAQIPKTGAHIPFVIASAIAAMAVMGAVVIRRRSIK